MPRKMRAAVIEQLGKPLILREWDVPSPGPGQILVKTEACGVCHTELQPLSSINQVFERLCHGDVPSRVVLDFMNT